LQDSQPTGDSKEKKWGADDAKLCFGIKGEQSLSKIDMEMLCG
jgi:hypothetical protein